MEIKVILLRLVDTQLSWCIKHEENHILKLIARRMEDLEGAEKE